MITLLNTKGDKMTNLFFLPIFEKQSYPGQIISVNGDIYRVCEYDDILQGYYISRITSGRGEPEKYFKIKILQTH